MLDRKNEAGYYLRPVLTPSSNIAPFLKIFGRFESRYGALNLEIRGVLLWVTKGGLG